MKKFIALLILFTMILTGCSSNNSSSIEYSTDENGNTIIQEEGIRTVRVSGLPYDLKYNGYSIPVSDVSVYENKVNHSYNLFVVITLDVSELDEDAIHWLRKDDLDVNVYIDGGQNEYDFQIGPRLGNIHWTDLQQLVFVHTSSFYEDNRYSFAGTELTVTVAATQEEKYEHKNSDGKVVERNKTEKVTYHTTLSDTIPSTDDIKKSLANYIAEWLYEKAEKIN